MWATGRATPTRARSPPRDYHELLREFLASMCTRRLGRIYCTYAEALPRLSGRPAAAHLRGPVLATEDRPTAIRFTLTKLSAVSSASRGPTVRGAQPASPPSRRGRGSFTWTPRGPGCYDVTLAAKELRTGFGKKDRVSETIEVESDAAGGIESGAS